MINYLLVMGELPGRGGGLVEDVREIVYQVFELHDDGIRDSSPFSKPSIFITRHQLKA